MTDRILGQRPLRQRDVECPAVSMHLAHAHFDVERRAEQGGAGDERVIFAVLAARIDAELFELADRVTSDRASEPALVKMRGARGDDHRMAPALDELLG